MSLFFKTWQIEQIEDIRVEKNNCRNRKGQEHLNQTGNKIVGSMPSLSGYILKNDFLLSSHDGLTSMEFLCILFHIDKEVLHAEEG